MSTQNRGFLNEQIAGPSGPRKWIIPTTVLAFVGVLVGALVLGGVFQTPPEAPEGLVPTGYASFRVFYSDGEDNVTDYNTSIDVYFFGDQTFNRTVQPNETIYVNQTSCYVVNASGMISAGFVNCSEDTDGFVNRVTLRNRVDVSSATFAIDELNGTSGDYGAGDFGLNTTVQLRCTIDGSVANNSELVTGDWFPNGSLSDPALTAGLQYDVVYLVLNCLATNVSRIIEVGTNTYTSIAQWDYAEIDGEKKTVIDTRMVPTTPMVSEVVRAYNIQMNSTELSGLTEVGVYVGVPGESNYVSL